MNRTRLIQGNGTAEDDWRAWLKTAVVNVCAIDAWLPNTRRLVVVAPHPDDEVLACGGLIAEHRDRGGCVVVIAVTDGEACHAGSPFWDPQKIAATRRLETLVGLRKLGVPDVAVTYLGLPDGNVALHSLNLAADLKILFRPSDLVLTTWRFDGHPDHEATGLAVSVACLSVGCQLIEAPVWMWHWAIPEEPDVPWDRLHRLPLQASVWERKQLALAAHVSQLEPAALRTEAILGFGIKARASRSDEYYFC